MTLLWFAAAACALAYWTQVLSSPAVARTVVKTLSVAILALIATIMGPVGLAVALALCAVGDACLSRPGDRAFMLGVGAFAAGHLAYIALFLSQPGSDPARLLETPRIFAVLGLLTLGVVMALRLLPAAGPLRGAVAVYIPIILGMGLAALCLPAGPSAALVLIGAASFILSDSLLAVETFLLEQDAPLSRVLARIVWPTYWAAQVLFLQAFTGIPLG